ncbi:hypothetical protein GCM10009786_26880 [Leucobacter alluvii]|uniref:Uncharacterized protein n=1 Tax=Leucobacter alluvii TaxID=340321 RepID=A0ABN3B9D4_9MICO
MTPPPDPALSVFPPAPIPVLPVAGVYETTLIGGLLNAALGAIRTLSVETRDPSGWISNQRTVTGSWVALGLQPPTCSMTPAA